MRVERGKIREFARAIKDDDPLYFDEAYAEGQGGMLAPVTFLVTVALWDDGEGRPPVPLDMTRLLHGEQEVEYFCPVRAGDVLTAVTRVADVYTKPGRRGGAMTFVVNETDFTDAGGAVVARLRNVRIETGQAVEAGQ
jgi:acyl dehydratase